MTSQRKLIMVSRQAVYPPGLSVGFPQMHPRDKFGLAKGMTIVGPFPWHGEQRVWDFSQIILKLIVLCL